MIPRNVSSILLATWAVSGVSLRACTACFGKTDEALAQGMNAGIYAMLVFVAAAWVLFGSFFVFIARRSRRVNGATGSVDPEQAGQSSIESH